MSAPSGPAQPVLSVHQYVHLLCGSPLEEMAAHTGTTTTKIAAKLTENPLPAWMKHLTVNR